MNWLRFQLELNQILHEAEKRREAFEKEEQERKVREIAALVIKFSASK